MAASKTLDSTTTSTPADAFKYSLPQVRHFHRTLTSDLDEKNVRLRTLVGGSYRQLLGTAEMILEMRSNMQVVEESLGRVGEVCGRAIIGKKVVGLGKLYGDKRLHEKADLGTKELEWIAKTKVLDMCIFTVGRVLRRTGELDAGGGRSSRLVLAAKLLVLSRLLAKSLSDLATDTGVEEQESLDAPKRKLETLRRKLRREIGKAFANRNSIEDREDIVQALAAYSLATSSGAKDTMIHFLHVRGEAIALSFEDDDDPIPEFPGILRALELYTTTLLDVQALVPRRLSGVLHELKTKELLQDDAIRELEILRLDVCERWFGDEILYFTPYVRHDDLEGSQAVDILKGWAKKASEVLMQGLTKTMERMTDFKHVIQLRTKIFEIWIKDGGKAKGFDPSIIFHELRKVVNNRILQLLESRVSKLELVGAEIEETLLSWGEDTAKRRESLWDEGLLDMDINHGAGPFKKAILARTYGRSDTISRIYAGHQAWRQLLDEIFVSIEQLKKERWNDDLEVFEDDLSLESWGSLLSQEDPQMFQESLGVSLENHYHDLHNKVEVLWTRHRDEEHVGQIAIYFLRIVRDIRIQLPNSSSLQSFGLSVVPLLHDELATTVALGPIARISNYFGRKQVAGRELWEGTPNLPVQPSPVVFIFLRNLSQEMSNAGGDLWSSKAIIVLKQHLNVQIAHHWDSALNTQEENVSAHVNGDPIHVDTGSEKHGGSNEADADKRKDILIQALFDSIVLQSCLHSTSTDGEDQMGNVVKHIQNKLELESTERKRLDQGAKDYWKRICLLFGLLA